MDQPQLQVCICVCVWGGGFSVNVLVYYLIPASSQLAGYNSTETELHSLTDLNSARNLSVIKSARIDCGPITPPPPPPPAADRDSQDCQERHCNFRPRVHCSFFVQTNVLTCTGDNFVQNLSCDRLYQQPCPLMDPFHSVPR